MTAIMCAYGNEFPLIKDKHDKFINYQKLHFIKNNLSLKMFDHTICTIHAAFLFGWENPCES